MSRDTGVIRSPARNYFEKYFPAWTKKQNGHQKRLILKLILNLEKARKHKQHLQKVN